MRKKTPKTSGYIFIVLLLALNISVIKSQNIVSGFVSDKNTGEKLIGVSVFNDKGKGTVTNEYGFFSLDAQKDRILSFSFIGYKVKKINIKQDTVVDVKLEPADNEIDEVVISSQKKRIEETEVSTVYANIKDIQKLPSLGGETDIIRSLKLYPGIQSGNEGTTGLYIRGGGPDQNLFLLDGIPLYNISHLFGFMSVFNDDALNSIKVIKGGFPARYGGRLSSVVDVRLKEGNSNKISGNFSAGLISSKFMLEGPVKKNKISFLISARRTYIDAIMHSVYYLLNTDEDFDATYYHFYDITGKINFKLSDKNRFYLSLYSGNDNFVNKFYFKGKDIKQTYFNKLNWGSKLLCFRYNRIFSKKVFFNTSLYYSYYHLINSSSQKFENTQNNSENNAFKINYSSDIKDIGFISDIDFFLSSKWFIKTGFSGKIHNFLPGIKTLKIENGGNNIDNKFSDGVYIPAKEFRAFTENRIKISSKIKLNIGINSSLFTVQDTVYHSFEPRVNGVFLISNNASLKVSYSQMQQYLHLLTNSGFGLPADLWVPPTSLIPPQKSEQYTFGFYKNLSGNITLSVEAYYKRMQNMITYKDNTSYFIENKNWDSKVLKNGKGKSYGAELLVQKNFKKSKIMLAYTLSETTRQFEELNNGKEYPYKYDRRHDIALSFIYNINKKAIFSANWVFGSGNAVTLPVVVYPSTMYPPPVNSFEGTGNENNFLPSVIYRTNTEIFDYGERNSQRLPSYHRLDINFTFKKKKKRGERLFSVGLYNAYNRKNPYYLIYAFSNDAFGDYNTTGEFHIISLFPVLPSVSYSFKF